MRNTESLLKTVFQDQTIPNSQEAARKLRRDLLAMFADSIAKEIEIFSGSLDEFNEIFPLDSSDLSANFMFLALKDFQIKFNSLLDEINNICTKAISLDRFCYPDDIGYFIEKVGETYKTETARSALISLLFDSLSY